MSTPPPTHDAGSGAPRTGGWLAQLRVLTLALCLSPVLLLVVAYASLGSGEEAWAYPDVWVPVTIGVLAVAAFLTAETVGFQVAPIAPGTPTEQATAQAVERFRAQLFVRFALTEATVLVGLVLSFVTAGMWPIVIAMVLGWPVLVWEAYPRRRTVERFAEKLESEGARTALAEAL